jgi:ATP-dependent Lon protease
LREQLKAMHKELGDQEGKTAETHELRKKIQSAKMPTEVEQEALKELARFERLPEGAEYSMVRTYLHWIVELPWSTANEERIDLTKSREILDADHHDLEKVKKRILEFLAVRKLNPGGKALFFALLVPPESAKPPSARVSQRQ